MASKELIEKVARAIARRWMGADKWHILREEGRELYRGDAEAAISTIIDALQEPTEGMEFAVDPDDCPTPDAAVRNWRAMLKASPLGEQSE